jgi:hypothetical protein
MTSVNEAPAITLTGGAGLPVVGFGTWRLHGTSAYNAVRIALDVGYRHIDTAAFYRNEAELGHAVRDSAEPAHDKHYAEFVEHPELARLLPVLYPGVFPNLEALDPHEQTSLRSCSPVFPGV